MVYGSSTAQETTGARRSCSGVSWFDESWETLDFLEQHPAPQGGGHSAAMSQERARDMPADRPGHPQKQPAPKDSGYTTVMLQNIPNKYTRDMLVDRLGRTGFKSAIDYLYLPIDFRNQCNIGYCFINFRTVASRQAFTKRFDGVAVQSCLPGFNSQKVCKVTRAKLQGREENLRRLRTSSQLMAQLAQHPDWLPLLFNESGDEEAFSSDDDGATSQASYSSHSHPQAVGMYAAAPVGTWGGGWSSVPMTPTMAPMMIGLPIAPGEQQHGMQQHGMQQQCILQQGMMPQGMQCAQPPQCQFGGLTCLVLYEPSCQPPPAWNARGPAWTAAGAMGGCSGYTTSASGGSSSSSPGTEAQDERETIPDSSRGSEPYDDAIPEEM